MESIEIIEKYLECLSNEHMNIKCKYVGIMYEHLPQMLISMISSFENCRALAQLNV
jgi:hypothetical protein